MRVYTAVTYILLCVLYYIYTVNSSEKNIQPISASRVTFLEAKSENQKRHRDHNKRKRHKKIRHKNKKTKMSRINKEKGVEKKDKHKNKQSKVGKDKYKSSSKRKRHHRYLKNRISCCKVCKS
ncbi:hypothetical protein cand_035290 [Cryptosporidium andersoni]|uniref:Uncharacterized protein n=1 Tax=Cryptosporidium andersoni TaxID=117008 RepID=A0A1J4MVI2_9CRYT|nr:hypothetical protein cand_035290 [Cryptosporidium andersoni]